ncbi:hypothetical protein MYXO_01812 [Myxococcaceae bacterium]|nr:hypothetical protein MYXO_01812 [Myxococcaceae bacterium]
MFEQPRFPREALIPLLAGIAWLWPSASFGVIGFLGSLPPGCLLLGAGMAMWLWPGDHRIDQFAAVGGVLGVIFALPAWFTEGPAVGAWLTSISVASFLAAGWASVRQEPHHAEVPVPVPSLGLAAKVAIDEAILSTMQLGASVPTGEAAKLASREVLAAREMFDSRGWLEKPAGYHVEPPPLEAFALRPREVRGRAFEELSFESAYEPHEAEPGRDRWLSYAANRTAHAWVVRQEDESRPWLVCIHGYQMGHPLTDLFAFDPRWLAKELGLNLVMPVLPLHGPRKQGRRSGDGFFSGSILDSIHAEAQAVWDIRRILSFVRSRGATRVGVFGLSLGGYNTALVSSVAPGLACAIAGIPATDFARLVWRHGPPLQVRSLEHKGVARDAVDEVLRVVSPLAHEPKVPFEGRAIFGAIADRLVPADQVRDLWIHWRRPKMLWYQGSHLSLPFEAEVRRFVESQLRESGLVGS